MLSGRIAGIAASPVLGCAIRDIRASGAQIWLQDAQPIPDEVYLIDVKNHVAYDCGVQDAGCCWARVQAGLSPAQDFAGSIALLKAPVDRRETPIDAKLRQIEVLTAQGMPLEDAIRTAGATRSMHRRWRIEDELDGDQAKRLKKLAAEENRRRKPDSPLPETNGCARQCLESLLGLLDEAAPGVRALRTNRPPRPFRASRKRAYAR